MTDREITRLADILEERIIARFEPRLGRIDDRFDRIDARFDRVDARLDRIEQQVGAVRKDIGSLAVLVNDLHSRVVKLEEDER